MYPGLSVRVHRNTGDTLLQKLIYAYDNLNNEKTYPDKVVTKMSQTLENPGKFGPNLVKGIITEINFLCAHLRCILSCTSN